MQIKQYTNNILIIKIHIIPFPGKQKWIKSCKHTFVLMTNERKQDTCTKLQYIPMGIVIEKVL